VSDAPFDIGGPLPAGVTVLEASAGTGKTYTIAALAARYVAQGTPLERMLLVTFTRMATGELRERVRERLVAVERGLVRVLAGGRRDDADDADEVVNVLAQGSPAQLRERCERLSYALANFDAATIATTHGFCQEVLAGLGIAGDLAAGTVFVEDLSDLLEEVVDDLYVRRFHGRETPPFDRAQALRIARAATDNPTAPIEPEGAPPDTHRAMRVRFAHAVRCELDERKQRGAVMTYDDLVGGLKAALGGPVVAARLRERFSVVLVDEFQDTDPDQWQIMRDAFGSGDATLVLIGDPKQAIYAFRGADVYAYLEAAASAAERRTLAVNWRSDQPLLSAYDALFAGARLGHEGIAYRTVAAAPPNRAARLFDAPVGTPLRVRVARRDDPALGLTEKGFAAKDAALRFVARDLVADLVGLLSSRATVEIGGEDGAPARREPIRPGHVAVLVRTNSTAALMRDALHEAGVPAVVSGAGSVFGTPAATEWLDLLKAIERPAHDARARSAALTSFVGWDAERVARADVAAWEEVHRRLHEWARVLRSSGVAALAERITLTEDLPARVLASADGERRLTDLRHVAQLLHGAAASEQLGTTALVSWLRRRIAEFQRDSANEERSRRLESDDEAVQILTIHRSKGLEFPIVLCPDLWDGRRPTRRAEWIAYHEPVDGDERRIDVGASGPGWSRHLAQHNAEQRGEDLRLAYVALTRARHQAVVWWAGSFDSRHSALARLLLARGEDEDVASLKLGTPSDDAVTARLRELADAAPGCIGVEVATAAPGPVARWSRPPAAAVALGVATFDRLIDLRWRRTSYSDITSAAHDPLVGSEPEEGVLADEPLPADAAGGAGVGVGVGAGVALGVGVAGGGGASGGERVGVAGAGGVAGAAGGTADAAGDEAALRAVASPLAAMAVGMNVGTLVHRVLQTTDFAAPQLEGELAARVAEAQLRRRAEIGEPAAVVAGLAAALRTPLGPLLGGRRLCDVARADRLDELEFELPLAGGDAPSGGGLELTAIAALLRAHLPSGDPLAGYAQRLEDPALRSGVRGFLTGSLDLVLRVRDADGAQRFAVVDYKTNWLAGPGEQLSAWHHRPGALTAEMHRYHYGLQALLYTAALHRYLRWRVRGYDPGRNLAGVLYLFLRGMSGPGTPAVGDSPCGVFAWRPPPALVIALSDVLDRGSAR
jgi:exodeoxyribonuclease V beta subunit